MYSIKTEENLLFYGIFRTYKTEVLVRNELQKEKLLSSNLTTITSDVKYTLKVRPTLFVKS